MMGVAGDKCDRCARGYYGFHGDGCSGRETDRQTDG